MPDEEWLGMGYIRLQLEYGARRVTEYIGLLAAMLTTASFLPQAIMVVRTRNTDGISLAMYVMFTAGVAGWFIYGLMIGSAPVIIANCVTLVLAAIILAIKVVSVSRFTSQRRVRAQV